MPGLKYSWDSSFPASLECSHEAKQKGREQEGEFAVRIVEGLHHNPEELNLLIPPSVLTNTV